MAVLQVLIIIWTACIVVLIGLTIYRAQLTRHEFDEVFLNDNVEHNREIEHDDIVRQVDRVDPFLKGTGGAAALMTLAVIGVYIMQILPSLHF